MIIDNKYTLKDIASITGGKCYGESNKIINHIYYDTRLHIENNGHLFIAIKTLKNDGNKYIQIAYKKGVRLFLVQKKPSKILPEASYLLVENTILALQSWATFHRKKFKIPILAITGSYGKTIIKEWIYHLIKKEYKVIRSPKSFNSQLGTALSLLLIDDNHEIAIIETGISAPGEMDKLKEMVNPTHSILSSVGKAHLDNFKDISELYLEKEKILPNTEYTYFKDKNWKPYKTIKEDVGQTIKTDYQGLKEQFTIRQKGSISAHNFICALRFLEQIGIKKNLIQNECYDLPELALRMEKKKGILGSTIINDSYCADLPSIKIALDVLKSESEHHATTFILSDFSIKENKEKDFFKQLIALIKAYKITQFIGIGSYLYENQKKFSKNFLFYRTPKNFISKINTIDFNNHFILVKGNKEKDFQKIVLKLEAKKHNTTLTIDLKNLESNYFKYKEIVPKKTKILVMIKAAGYGTGLIEIGKKLSKINVDFLGVAYTDEGVELRKNNIQTPILVMNVENKSMEDVIDYQLTPAIYDLNQLNEFTNKLIGLGIKNYPVHIKINTGMNRMGIELDEIDELINYITAQTEIKLEGVFSHLAASDLKKGKTLTNQQINQFNLATKKIENITRKKFLKHILNTSGIENYSKYSFDMVRLGIGVYGISSQIKLENVATLNTKLSKIRTVSSNEQVGYGITNITDTEIKLGIIPIGYADGFSRSSGNGKGSVFINGFKVPTFGNICMDMSFIDLTNIKANVGDTVEIFGINNSIKGLAKEINTIPYEILSSISQRVVRVYEKD